MSESDGKLHLHTKPKESPKRLAITFAIALAVFVVAFLVISLIFGGSSKSKPSPVSVNPPPSSSTLAPSANPSSNSGS